MKAKDQQAAEANKNASILLKELDLEKVRLRFRYELSVISNLVQYSANAS